jgi:hypothetical protein
MQLDLRWRIVHIVWPPRLRVIVARLAGALSLFTFDVLCRFPNIQRTVFASRFCSEKIVKSKTKIEKKYLKRTETNAE